MIVAQNLTKLFNDFVAVDHISLEVGEGEVLALLGPNGAGKTTTIRMLTSVLRPSQGTARVAGYDITTQAAHVRASVGVLTEHHGLYNRMPADAYLDFFGQVYDLNKETRLQRTRELLKQFGLEEAARKPLGEYSKGMRQKLALARALLHSPPVLLLDEPTSAMDPESARLVRDSISDLRSEERAIIICTHNLVEAEELADQIAIIRRGKIIALGSKKGLTERLLGPAEYELHLASTSDGIQPYQSEHVMLTAKGSNWVRYRVHNPGENNPHLLRYYLDCNAAVLSLEEVPRSLEKVYLHAISAPDSEEVMYAG